MMLNSPTHILSVFMFFIFLFKHTHTQTWQQTDKHKSHILKNTDNFLQGFVAQNHSGIKY